MKAFIGSPYSTERLPQRFSPNVNLFNIRPQAISNRKFSQQNSYNLVTTPKSFKNSSNNPNTKSSIVELEMLKLKLKAKPVQNPMSALILTQRGNTRARSFHNQPLSLSYTLEKTKNEILSAIRLRRTTIELELETSIEKAFSKLESELRDAVISSKLGSNRQSYEKAKRVLDEADEAFKLVKQSLDLRTRELMVQCGKVSCDFDSLKASIKINKEVDHESLHKKASTIQHDFEKLINDIKSLSAKIKILEDSFENKDIIARSLLTAHKAKVIIDNEEMRKENMEEDKKEVEIFRLKRALASLQHEGPSVIEGSSHFEQLYQNARTFIETMNKLKTAVIKNDDEIINKYKVKLNDAQEELNKVLNKIQIQDINDEELQKKDQATENLNEEVNEHKNIIHPKELNNGIKGSLGEIENKVTTLYNELKEEYGQKVRVLMQTVRGIKEKLSKLKKQSPKIKPMIGESQIEESLDLDNLKAKINKLNMQNLELRNKIRTLNEEKTNLESSIKEVNTDNKKLKNDNKLAVLSEEIIKQLKKDITKLNDEKTQLEDKLNKWSEENEKLKDEANRLNEENSQLNIKLTTTTKKYTQQNTNLKNKVSNLEASNKQFLTELNDLKEQNVDINNILTQLNTDIETLKEENNTLQNDLSKAEIKKKELENKVNNVLAENKDIAVEIKNIKEENKKLMSEIESANTENEGLRTEINEAKAENNKLKTEVRNTNTENMNLKTELNKANRQNKQLKDSLKDIDGSMKKEELIEKKLADEEIAKLELEKKQLESEINKAHSDLNTLNAEIDKMGLENRELKEELNKLKQEQADINTQQKESENVKLREEIKRLKEEKALVQVNLEKVYEGQLAESKELLIHAVQQVEHKHRQATEEYIKLINSKSNQIENVSTLLENLINAISEHIDSQIEEINALREENESLRNINQGDSNENEVLERLMQSLVEEQKKSNTLQQQLLLTISQNNELKIQLQGVQEDYMQFGSMLNTCLENETTNREYINNLLNQINELTHKHKNLYNDYNKIKEGLQSLLQQLRVNFNKLKCRAKDEEINKKLIEELKELKECNEKYKERVNQLEENIGQLKVTSETKEFMRKAKFELTIMKYNIEAIKSGFDEYRCAIVEDLNVMKKIHERAKALSENSLNDQRTRQLEISGSIEENKEGAFSEMMPKIKEMLIKLQTKNSVLRSKCEALTTENEELKAQIANPYNNNKETIQLRKEIENLHKENLRLVDEQKSIAITKSKLEGRIKELERRPVFFIKISR